MAQPSKATQIRVLAIIYIAGLVLFVEYLAIRVFLAFD